MVRIPSSFISFTVFLLSNSATHGKLGMIFVDAVMCCVFELTHLC